MLLIQDSTFNTTKEHENEKNDRRNQESSN